MFEYPQGYEFIAGVDEVGRGPLVGAVVTAAVILDPNNPIEGLADSKKLSEKKRLALAEEIKEKALVWALGRAEANEIDVDSIAVAVDEARIIMDPEIVNECHNVVVRPISENSDAFIFVDMMLEAFENTGDVTFMNMIIDETEGGNSAEQGQKVVDANGTDNKPAGDGDKEVGTIRKWLDKIKENCYNRPKEWIANKIAALNLKAEAYKKKTAEMGDKAPWYRKIVDMIMKAIAWLTAKMSSPERRTEVAKKLADEKAKKDAEAK